MTAIRRESHRAHRDHKPLAGPWASGRGLGRLVKDMVTNAGGFLEGAGPAWFDAGRMEIEGALGRVLMQSIQGLAGNFQGVLPGIRILGRRLGLLAPPGKLATLPLSLIHI